MGDARVPEALPTEPGTGYNRGGRGARARRIPDIPINPVE